MEKTKLLEDFEKWTGIKIKSLIVVYGSLRKEMSNSGILNARLIPKFPEEKINLKDTFGKYGLESLAKHIGTIYLGEFKSNPEYTMYSLGGFPGVVEGGTTSIVYEVFGVIDSKNNKTEKYVEGLEGWRGEQYNDPDSPYSNMYNKKMVNTPYGNGTMYIYNTKRKLTSIVEDGDWTKYVKARQQQDKTKVLKEVEQQFREEFEV